MPMHPVKPLNSLPAMIIGHTPTTSLPLSAPPALGADSGVPPVAIVDNRPLAQPRAGTDLPSGAQDGEPSATLPWPLPPAPTDSDSQNSTCASLTSCFTCLRNERCGWCANDNLCIPGDVWGPTSSLQCSSKWDYMSGQCYFTQSTLLIGIFTILLSLLLLLTSCAFLTYYRLKRQRLVAREYVRLFSEYSAYQHAVHTSRPNHSSGAGGGRLIRSTSSRSNTANPDANFSTSSLLHHAQHQPTFAFPGTEHDPNVSALPTTPSLAWYGSFQDDNDADAEPWDPCLLRRNDSGAAVPGSSAEGTPVKDAREVARQFRKSDDR